MSALAAGCGTTTHRAPNPAPSIPQPVAATPWPSAADYTTIKVAVAARDIALFHETDWRRRSYGASAALQTLLTLRIKRGRCAAYVTELYGNLHDLAEAYPREDWRPLVRLVHRQAALATACRRPSRPRAITIELF